MQLKDMRLSYRIISPRSARLVVFAAFVLCASTLTIAQSKPVVEIVPIKSNESIERDIRGGQAHRYRVDLVTDQFMQVRVEQKGVDVVVTLYERRGKRIAQMDSPNLAHGLKILSWVAGHSGVYIVEVAPFRTSITDWYLRDYSRDQATYV